MNRKVGHRFHPTDEEIINHFLRKKALGLGHEVSDDIAEVDVCKFEPWQLPDLAVNTSDYDLEWFFFCPCNYKYTNSRRANRTTKSGYWKVTGKDRKLWIIKGAKHQIGIKKTLVFHRGRVPNGIRTNWVIHEYHPTAFNFQNQRAYVICRLKQKADVKVEKSTADEGELCLQRPSDYRNILENAFPEGNPLVRTLTQNGWLDYDSSVEQGLDLQFSNGFCNDLNGLQYYDCSEHENEDFLNSLIVDPFEETVHTHHNGSRPSESLKVYVEGSRDKIHANAHEMCVPEIGTSHSKTLETSSKLTPQGFFSGHVSQKELQMRMIQASSGSDDASVNSITDILEICCLDLDDDKIPTYTSQYYQPRSRKTRAKDHARRFELQGALSHKALDRNMVEVEKHGNVLDALKSNSNEGTRKNLEMTQNNKTSCFNLSWNQAASADQMGFFVLFEAPQLSQNFTSPIYLFNALLGIFLLVVVIWEVLLFGDW